MVKMKNKLNFNLLIIFLLIFSLSPIMAKAERAKVYDDASLFSYEEVELLENEASLLSNDYDIDIIIITTNDANGKTSREYADDYFDYNEFGLGTNYDGILFLIDMDNRQAYISTSGIGIRYLTDMRIESILDMVFDGGLVDGNFYGASMAFIRGTEKYLAIGIPTDQYNEDVKVENSLTFFEVIIGSVFALGASAVFFFTTKARYKMKNPVKPLTFRNNSIVDLLAKEDRLVDTRVTYRIIPRPTSSGGGGTSGKSTTHKSSSGRTHGGGGRKF